jgi:hypothetical protein
MKYKVGDVLLIKDIRPHHLPRLHNTIGIITEVEKHTDLFEKDSTENDNRYIWYSQVDGREYRFFEDEAECEVIK